LKIVIRRRPPEAQPTGPRVLRDLPEVCDTCGSQKPPGIRVRWCVEEGCRGTYVRTKQHEEVRE
jgi:hypothetical protein